MYRDDDLLVFNKPSGLLVHRGAANDRDTALTRARDLVGHYVYPLHRLDRGASGALAFACSPTAASLFGKLWQERAVDKRYFALVRGVPPETGVIDYPLPKDEGKERVPAVTRFRRLAASSVDRCSLLEARPETGRLHQIRLHLRHLSHPLIGDVKHGRGDINRRYRELYALHRLALHCHALGFTHPLTGQELLVRAPVPEDLRGALVALQLPVLAEL